MKIDIDKTDAIFVLMLVGASFLGMAFLVVYTLLSEASTAVVLLEMVSTLALGGVLKILIKDYRDKK